MKLFQLAFILAAFVFAVPVFAQTDRDTGIQLYKNGNFDKAISSFKKAVKVDPRDFQGWTYLGLTYLKQNEIKAAIKALKTAAQLNPNETTVHIGLGYAYLAQNKLTEARTSGDLALKLEPKGAEANYIIGVVNFRNASYTAAYDRANAALAVAPEFSQAYLLKAQSLVISFVQQANTVMKPPESRYSLLQEAEESLSKYLTFAPLSEETSLYKEYLESIRFFSGYYNGPDFKPPSSIDSPGGIPDRVPVKILEKPRASYTDSARQAGVRGTVRLLVAFSAEGKIAHILVIKPLSHGLSEQATRAARSIKFQPATRNGKPISTVLTLEYGFQIY